MATATDAYALTTAYKTLQNRRAAAVAALVAAYYAQNVDVNSAPAVEAWLDIMVPRILAGHDLTGRDAAKFATAVRSLELPGEPKLTFTPSVGAIEEQVRKSLLVVGPGSYLNKAKQIEQLDVNPQQQSALLAEAKQETSRKVAAAAVRHVQNGGRQTVIDAVKEDRLALGYVRVTRAKPCFFCAMLASRGLVFAEDSFDLSDPRFTGDGTAKVHDECGCSMKPVYDRESDVALKTTEPFTEMWSRWGAGGGDALLAFRRGYAHWAKTGEYLTSAQVRA